jgi:hypothetical protein
MTAAHKTLLTEALENFNLAQQAYAETRRQARDDLRFVAGEQSPPGLDTFYKVNLLHPFLRQITAQAREAPPSIEVVPIGADDLNLAGIYEGLIRSIEQKCDATTAYQTALWYAAASGEGYLLLDTEYVTPDGFDQEITIAAAQNPEKVFLDPNHTLIDGCDAEWGFIVEDMGHAEFRRRFPKSALAKRLTGTKGWQVLNLPGAWISDKTVRVARYYVKTYEEQTLFRYLDPLTLEEVTAAEPQEDRVLLQKRKSYNCIIKAYVLTAYEVLDETVWPGKYLPIIKVTGDSYIVGDKRIQHGAVRFAKDPQKQFNFHLTRKTELIDLIPKVPFVAANGQVVDNPSDWANAHRQAVGTLTYKPITLEGQLVPPPSRPAGIDAAAFTAISTAQNDALEHLKLVFGMHGNPAMDAHLNEASGVALAQRADTAGKSVYQYYDNLLASLRCLGRQLVEIIPIIYDTDRIVRIVKPDQSEQLVAINSVSNNKRYDLSRGTYDVVVKTGPAFASRREKSLQAATSVLPLLPENQRALVSDQILRLVDDQTTRAMADRIKASQPPEVLAASGEDIQEDMAPAEMVIELQQQLAATAQQLKMLEMQKQELEIKVKLAEDKTALELVKHDAEITHKMRALEHEDEVAELEGRLKMKEMELAEKQLALKERELEIQAALAANKVVDGMRPIKDVNIPSGEDIGGKL